MLKNGKTSCGTWSSSFKVAHVPDDEKVSITSMCLFGDAKLWWHTRMGDDTKLGRP